MNILEELAAYARVRVAENSAGVPLEALREQAVNLGPGGGNAFRDALRKPELSFICEVKRASPSRGMIAQDFPYLSIARDYVSAGTDCISCLTEPKWFLGSDRIFREIREAVPVPMLRKDFTVDEYQIYEARCLGANAVLLICALLDRPVLEQYLSLCRDLGLAALVEAHDAAEIESALSAGAEIIGVNNRNLKDFSVDLTNAQRLRDLIPPETVYVAESGVTGPEDAAALRRAGADAVLVGEAMMRAPDKAAMLARMREAAG